MRLLFVGDVMLGRLVNEVLAVRSPASVWGDTLPLFAAADLRVCNLECALTDVGAPWARTPKTFHFRSAERNVAALLAAGIDLVSLANNHILDFEEAGLARTVAVLDAAAIGHAGAGRDLAAATAPAIRTCAGGRVGMLAFTDNEPDWAAGRTSPGVFHVDPGVDDERAAMLLDAVGAARSAVDCLVVSAHWGPNWGQDPPAEHRAFGRTLLEAGADIVFGHSCHTLRGVAVQGRRAILYGTGDFVDDYAIHPLEHNDRAAVFLVTLDAEGVARIEVEPTIVRDFAARRAEGIERDAILERMTAMSRALGSEVRQRPDGRSLEIVAPLAAGVQRGCPTGTR